MSCWSEEKFWAVEFLLHAGRGRRAGGAGSEGVTSLAVPSPLPPPVDFVFYKEAISPQREGDHIYLRIKFFQGAPPPSPQGHA